MIDEDDITVSWDPLSDFRPGIYRHTKSGNLYTAIGLVFHHEEQHPVVLYVSLMYGTPAVRPLYGWDEDPDAWLDWVEAPDGLKRRRFEFVEATPTDTPSAKPVR